MKHRLLAVGLVLGIVCGTSLLAGFIPVITDTPSADDQWCHTFSIVAYDPVAKEWGVGVASRVVAVGAVVPFAKANVGAVATQSRANKTYGPRGLKLLADGKTPQEVLDILTGSDKQKEVRQVGIIGPNGKVANFTGKGCVPYAGAKTGKNFSCQGNLLAGEAVITDMAKAFEVAKGLCLTPPELISDGCVFAAMN